MRLEESSDYAVAIAVNREQQQQQHHHQQQQQQQRNKQQQAGVPCSSMQQPITWLPAILEAPLPAAITERCSYDMDTSSIGSDSSVGCHSCKQQQQDHDRQGKQQHQQADTKQQPVESQQQQRKPLRLSAISKEQLQAHAAAYTAAAAAHISLHGHARHGCITTNSHTPSSCAAPDANSTEPISRISSWISTLPDPESAPSAGPEPEQPPSISSSNTVHAYEEAACAPSLARPSIWQSSVDSEVERQRLSCCSWLSFLGAI